MMIGVIDIMMAGMITGGEVDIGIMVTMMMNMIVVIIEADIEGVDGIKRMMVEEMVSGGVEEDKKGVAERADGIGRTEIVEIMTAGTEIGNKMICNLNFQWRNQNNRAWFVNFFLVLKDFQ